MTPMTVLVIIACIRFDAASCVEEKIPMPEMTQQACIASSMQSVAKWAGDHPQFTIGEWRCMTTDAYKI